LLGSGRAREWYLAFGFKALGLGRDSSFTLGPPKDALQLRLDGFALQLTLALGCACSPLLAPGARVFRLPATLAAGAPPAPRAAVPVFPAGNQRKSAGLSASEASSGA